MPANSPMSSTRGFRVHTYEIEGGMVVECHGKLTSENAPQLKEEVRALIPQQKRILLDLQEVPLMDSAGLGTVVGLYVTGRTRGCRVEVVNASKPIRELFCMANLLWLFEYAGRHGGKIICWLRDWRLDIYQTTYIHIYYV
jgi:anti-anti-sigma factor